MSADRTSAHSALVAAVRKKYGREPDLELYLNTKGRLRKVGGKDVYTAAPALGEGTSDLVGVLAPHGRFLCLEAKTGDADLMPNQKLFAARMKAKGAFFAVFRSVEEFGAALDRARRGEAE